MKAKQPAVAIKKAIKLADAPKADRIDLALALADAEDVKPGAVADLVKVRAKQRRALYALWGLGRWLKRVKLPMATCQAIRWTKLAILASHCQTRPGKKPSRTELDHAEKYTAAQLPAILKLGPQKAPAKARSVMLRLTPDQYAVFEAALKKHGAVKPPKGKGLQNKETALVTLISKAQALGV